MGLSSWCPQTVFRLVSPPASRILCFQRWQGHHHKDRVGTRTTPWTPKSTSSSIRSPPWASFFPILHCLSVQAARTVISAPPAIYTSTSYRSNPQISRNTVNPNHGRSARFPQSFTLLIFYFPMSSPSVQTHQSYTIQLPRILSILVLFLYLALPNLPS